MAEKILAFAPSHAPAVARLHRQAIRTGFLSRLGPRFLTELYRSIGCSPYSRVFVAFDRDIQKVTGFAACSLDTAAMYRHILKRRGLLFFFLLLPRAFHPENLRYICETLFYPGAARPDAGPQAELLSIAVSDDSRGKGVGRDLISALESYLRENRVMSYKTVTFSTDNGSNAFYKKCGFSFRREKAHHGNVLFEYVKEIGRP